MSDSEHKTIGVYGSLKRAASMGLRIAEYYAKPDPGIAGKAREQGLNYIPVLWVPETSSPSEGVVDVYSRQGLFAFRNSGCISNPKIRRRILERIEYVATKLESKTVILDALRFPSPHDKTMFFSCFCTHCRKAMSEEGIDLKSCSQT